MRREVAETGDEHDTIVVFIGRHRQKSDGSFLQPPSSRPFPWRQVRWAKSPCDGVHGWHSRPCFYRQLPPTNQPHRSRCLFGCLAVNSPHSRYRFQVAILVGSVLAAPIFMAGCDVRDEEVRRGHRSPWLPPVADRMAAPSQRAIEVATSNRLIEFVDGYAAGSRRAADGGLPMLLVFRASWCRWSDAFVADVCENPRLTGLAGRFVCVAVDADREPATCRSFGVQAFPTAIVLDRERRESFRATGADARAGLTVALESTLDASPRRIAGQPAAPSR